MPVPSGWIFASDPPLVPNAIHWLSGDHARPPAPSPWITRPVFDPSASATNRSLPHPPHERSMGTLRYARRDPSGDHAGSDTWNPAGDSISTRRSDPSGRIAHRFDPEIP